MGRRVGWWALSATSMLVACAATLTGNDDGSDTPDASSDGPPDVIVPAEASTDVGPDVVGDASEAGCSCLHGKCGIRIGTTPSFCIDPTEVTIREYKEFLAAKGNTAVPANGPCPATTIVVRPTRPDETLPITNVTFCEARAYCTWAGKSLCGTVDGKPLVVSQNATQIAAWYHVCTAGEGQPKILGGTCRTDAPGQSPLPSGTTCQGGYPDVFDMVGNVWEFIDFSNDAGSFFVGNAYGQARGANDCAATAGVAYDYNAVDLGFRCCAY